MDYFDNLQSILDKTTEIEGYKVLAFKGDANSWLHPNIGYSQRKKVSQKYVNSTVFIYNRYEGGHWRQVLRNSKGLYFYGYGGNEPIYFSLENLPKEMR